MPALRLRPATLADAPAMAALLEHDPAAVETTGRIRIPCTVEAARDWLALVTGPAPAGGLSLVPRARSLSPKACRLRSV